MAKLTTKEVTDNLILSINKSGRKFKDIPVSSVESFLKDFGVPQKDWKSIYENVSYILGVGGNSSKKEIVFFVFNGFLGINHRLFEFI